VTVVYASRRQAFLTVLLLPVGIVAVVLVHILFPLLKLKIAMGLSVLLHPIREVRTYFWHVGILWRPVAVLELIDGILIVRGPLMERRIPLAQVKGVMIERRRPFYMTNGHSGPTPRFWLQIDVRDRTGVVQFSPWQVRGGLFQLRRFAGTLVNMLEYRANIVST